MVGCVDRDVDRSLVWSCGVGVGYMAHLGAAYGLGRICCDATTGFTVVVVKLPSPSLSVVVVLPSSSLSVVIVLPSSSLSVVIALPSSSLSVVVVLPSPSSSVVIALLHCIAIVVIDHHTTAAETCTKRVFR